MGRRKKRSKKTGSTEESEKLIKAPHSFVIKRGHVGKNVAALMHDFRKVMEPYTASKLKVNRKNVLRDFVSIASTLNVTHLIVFTKTSKAVYIKLCRLPRGPTLTFKLFAYSLCRDVLSSLKKPLMYSALYQLSPLLVMNSFTGEDELQFKLITSMWRNLFPSIDVNCVNLNAIRRCVLLNYHPDKKLIDFRHYAIKVKPVGLSRQVKKLVTSKRIPDLGRFRSIDEIMSLECAFTESEGEAEDLDETRQVTLAQNISSRGNMLDEKSAIRLVEIGPRMTLQLMKIEEGLMDGEVLYHSIIKKTKAEKKELKNRRENLRKLKLSRKKQQEENVRKKSKKVRFKKGEDEEMEQEKEEIGDSEDSDSN